MIASALPEDSLASVDRIAREYRDPYFILVSTMISLRTKDAVTLEASRRLFQRARTAAELSALDEVTIAELIFPAGFYRTKAANLKRACAQLLDQHGGEVPRTLDELLALPGVGIKTANLVLGVGHGIPAICVDTHVHRIFNRLGLISTAAPEESEVALRFLLSRKFWTETNSLLVRFGQQICTPTSPHCSKCPLSGGTTGHRRPKSLLCRRIGVTRSR